MKQIILGTAGHIDHGKTSLVKALSGVDTDRLKEEKRRGITIELGFASLALPDGQRLGIVDVPGHEKFIKNMVAGATGIDIVAMIIAADEGVMPQTREHMEICTLLGVKHGLVVLTKIDMVEPEWLELVMEDVHTFTQGSFLEDAPVAPVSSITGQGIDSLKSLLQALCAPIVPRGHTGLFRLPVDRVFSMKGFGTVITGTLISGRIKVGETVEVYPSGATAKVRGIQVHNMGVEEAKAGMRTAINFQGLEKAMVNRGDVLGRPDTLRQTYMVDVSLRFLASNPKALKNRTRVRLHTGTSEIMGNVILPDRDELAPGEAATAQIRLDAPVTVLRDDRFVIRSYSPVRTIGGGRILNPMPPKHKRFKPATIELLKWMREKTADELVPLFIEQSGHHGLPMADLLIMTNLPEKSLDHILQDLLSRQIVIQTDKENRIFLHQAVLETLRETGLAHLRGYHQNNPLKSGMSREELKSKFPPDLSAKIFALLLNRMAKDGQIVQEGETVRLATHKIALGVDQDEIRARILAAYAKSGLAPPTVKELCRNLDLDAGLAKDMLGLLKDQGSLIKVKEDLFFHTDSIADLKARLVAHLQAQGQIDTPGFKEMTGVSRKFLIPLFEYFDGKNITIRVGDIRKLRKG